jgi:hypothetical protein
MRKRHHRGGGRATECSAQSDWILDANPDEFTDVKKRHWLISSFAVRQNASSYACSDKLIHQQVDGAPRFPLNGRTFPAIATSGVFV